MKHTLLLLCLGTHLAAMELDRSDLPQTPPSNALHEAVKNNDKELVRQLIAQGADVNANEPGLKGNVPLCLAIENDNVEIMELLLKAGAQVDAVVFVPNILVFDKNPARRISCHTLLMQAVAKWNESGIKLLLEYGANPFIRNNNEAEAVFVVLKKNFAFYKALGRNISMYCHRDMLNLCNDHVKKYKKLYQQLLLIQQSAPHTAVPREMLNHILWIATGLLCSQVRQFKP